MTRWEGLPKVLGMSRLLPGLTLIVVLLASCGGAATAPTSAPTVAPTTATATTVAPTATPTASAPATTAAPSPLFAASECTNATATTRQVIERYFALSTSNNAQAVIDCFAKVWRDKNNVNPTIAESATRWSQAGPASGLVITFIDAVNGCDRFGVSAQMATYGPAHGNAFTVTPFFTVGPEAGTPRIFEMGTALVNTQAATTTCK